MFKNKKHVGTATSHDRSVYASPPLAARATKNPSRAAPFVGFFSATFWPAAMLRIALLGGPKRHIQPERYAQFFVENG
jgi:hypothetical protein